MDNPNNSGLLPENTTTRDGVVIYWGAQRGLRSDAYVASSDKGKMHFKASVNKHPSLKVFPKLPDGSNDPRNEKALLHGVLDFSTCSQSEILELASRYFVGRYVLREAAIVSKLSDVNNKTHDVKKRLDAERTRSSGTAAAKLAEKEATINTLQEQIAALQAALAKAGITP